MVASSLTSSNNEISVKITHLNTFTTQQETFAEAKRVY